MLYAGPDVSLPIRYSAMMNMIYVTFAFGIGMPLLIPICCIMIVNMYITERLQFAWFYKKPPMMGNILNDRGLGVLLKAPIGMAIIGYYMLGNRQMFHNEMPIKDYHKQPYKPNHALVDYSDGFNITFAFFLLAVVLLLFKLYNILLQKCGRATKLF